ncbi:MAG TPA: xanthine dehydrogenase family protein subunit M [Azospirillaceae bacterium]|nr:xanthine dehydrogenase family protein subunit M [Azospirillaceae bacterium]
MYAFDYHRPTSLDEAVRLLGTAEDPKLLAGGQTLIPTLKQRLARPSDLVDLGRVEGMRGIREEAGGLTVGAMTTHATVAGSELVRRVAPALADLAGHIGDAQVRSLGTIGGSICNADPAADYPAAVVALGATVRTNKRQVAGGDFFTGMFETALDEGEIVTAVHFPRPARACYAKFRNPASRYAVVGVFVAETADGIRVAVTGAGPSVFRWTEAEAALAADFAEAALDGLTVAPDDLNSDLHASAEYRAHLVKVMAKRAVAGC